MEKKPAGQHQMRSVSTTDPEESTQAAGLRYVSDTQPGIRRQRVGRGFCYRGVHVVE